MYEWGLRIIFFVAKLWGRKVWNFPLPSHHSIGSICLLGVIVIIFIAIDFDKFFLFLFWAPFENILKNKTIQERLFLGKLTILQNPIQGLDVLIDKSEHLLVIFLTEQLHNHHVVLFIVAYH